MRVHERMRERGEYVRCSGCMCKHCNVRGDGGSDLGGGGGGALSALLGGKGGDEGGSGSGALLIGNGGGGEGNGE